MEVHFIRHVVGKEDPHHEEIRAVLRIGCDGKIRRVGVQPRQQRFRPARCGRREQCKPALRDLGTEVFCNVFLYPQARIALPVAVHCKRKRLFAVQINFQLIRRRPRRKVQVRDREHVPRPFRNGDVSRPLRQYRIAEFHTVEIGKPVRCDRVPYHRAEHGGDKHERDDLRNRTEHAAAAFPCHNSLLRAPYPGARSSAYTTIPVSSSPRSTVASNLEAFRRRGTKK